MLGSGNIPIRRITLRLSPEDDSDSDNYTQSVQSPTDPGASLGYLAIPHHVDDFPCVRNTINGVCVWCVRKMAHANHIVATYLPEIEFPFLLILKPRWVVTCALDI